MKQKQSLFKRHGMFKRIMAYVLVFAMVVTMGAFSNIVGQGTQVKAESISTVKLYFELPEGTSATDWGVNVWNTAEVTVTEADTSNSFTPNGWGNGVPALLVDPNLSGWAYATVSGKVTGMQFVNKNGTAYNCWNNQIAVLGCTEAYYVPSENKWYKDSAKSEEVKEAEVRNIFVLAGAEKLAGSGWNLSDANNVFTQDENNEKLFSLTRKNVPAGTYEYKILQDPENKSWELPWGSSENRTVTVEKKSDVTFTINLDDTDKGVTVSQKQVVDIKIHFKNYDNWTEVATKATEGESWTSISGYESYNNWPGVVLEEDSTHPDYYTLSITGKSVDSSFNCIFNDNVNGSGKQTSNIVIATDELAASNGSLEYWCISKSGDLLKEAPDSWTTGGSDDQGTAKECVLTLNFKSSWEHAESYLWSGEEKPAGAWPGKQMTATPGHDGWYTVHLVVDGSTNYNCILNNKLNNDSGTQLEAITLATKDKTDVEYWYDGTTLSTDLPTGWNYTTTIHYLALGMGDTIYNHMWDGDSSIAGPGVGKSWPGGLATANAEHEGWYDAVYTQDTQTDFYCIFNNNKGTQTENIPVEVTSTNTEIWVTGTKNASNTTVYKVAPDTWEKAPEPYSFTMYYYNPDLSVEDIEKVDLWMWNAGLNGAYAFTDTWYDADNDVTWFKQTITTTDDQIGNTAGLKARYDNTSSNNGWDGGSDNADRSFTISGVVNETWYYVDGQNPVSEKPVIMPSAPRYFVLDYVNDGLYETGVTPQFYTWTSGYAAALKNFTYVGNGKWTVTVPVKASCSKVDYVIALDSSSDPWVKDGGDHSIEFPTTQRVVYAKMVTGGEPELAMPYNTGYQVQAVQNQAVFYYRDDDAFVGETLKNMNVAVDINGTEHDMTYNDATKRFEYTMSGLESGKTYYRYKVGSEYVTDAFNANSESYNSADYSYFEYYKLNATITAEVMNPTFNYNENNVVKFTVNQDSSDAQKFKVASATIDVSSLGGSSELAIEPELQAVTISATTGTSLGKKTLPITVTDQYGNEFTTSVNVEVVNRVKKDSDDFDWDEAVVYFMLTDRFFDGNITNNTASGTDTYGDNEGLYHGGDFAGVTAKLDYLKELGVNTIWITPIVENIPGVIVSGDGKEDVPYNAAYHGYWASDFTKLNPTLGTTDEFQTMINEAHKRGMRIMVDIVINHAGYGTEDIFGDMIRDKSIGEGDILSWQSGMPDFATEDPDVRAQLVAWQTSWMKDYGVDYFRVDTVKHVESTTWAALKNSTTTENPSFKMIGEYYGAGYAANGKTLGTGQMDAALDFDFNDQASSFVSGNISSVEKFLAGRNAVLNNTYMTGQFLSSHDEDGFKQSLMSGKGWSEEQATSASLVAATLQFTAKGIPVIYYGEEVGLTGLNNYPYQTNRYDMDFSLATESNVTYMHYKTMLNIRKEYSTVFARGDRKVVVSSDEEGYDVIARTYDGTTLYVGMNIKDTAKTVQIPVGGDKDTVYTDLYSNTQYAVNKDGVLDITIPAAKDGGTVVLVKTGEPDVPSVPDTPSTSDTISTPGTQGTTKKPSNSDKKSEPQDEKEQSSSEEIVITGQSGVTAEVKADTVKEAQKQVEALIEKIKAGENVGNCISTETLENILKAIEAKKEIVSKIEIVPAEEAKVSKEDRSVIEEALRDIPDTTAVVVQYFDIAVLLCTTDGEVLGTYHELSNTLSFNIAIPKELNQEGRSFIVVRIHNGEITILDTVMNADGTLTFETDRFSIYALAYTDDFVKEVAHTVEENAPIIEEMTKTESSTPWFAIIAVIVLLAAGALLAAYVMKKKE